MVCITCVNYINIKDSLQLIVPSWMGSDYTLYVWEALELEETVKNIQRGSASDGYVWAFSFSQTIIWFDFWLILSIWCLIGQYSLCRYFLASSTYTFGSCFVIEECSNTQRIGSLLQFSNLRFSTDYRRFISTIRPPRIGPFAEVLDRAGMLHIGELNLPILIWRQHYF